MVEGSPRAQARAILAQGPFHPGAKRRCPGAPAPARPMLPCTRPRGGDIRLQLGTARIMGNSPLEQRVTQAAEATLAEQGYVSAVDVLLHLGWLAPPHLDLWRQGRVACLERTDVPPSGGPPGQRRAAPSERRGRRSSSPQPAAAHTVFSSALTHEARCAAARRLLRSSVAREVVMPQGRHDGNRA